MKKVLISLGLFLVALLGLAYFFLSPKQETFPLQKQADAYLVTGKAIYAIQIKDNQINIVEKKKKI